MPRKNLWDMRLHLLELVWFCKPTKLRNPKEIPPDLPLADELYCKLMQAAIKGSAIATLRIQLKRLQYELWVCVWVYLTKNYNRNYPNNVGAKKRTCITCARKYAGTRQQNCRICALYVLSACKEQGRKNVRKS